MDADCRKCMQENSRTYETMKSWDQVASEPLKIHEMTPQQRQAQFKNQWYVVQTTAEGSNTIPTRQHPELGQAHRVVIRRSVRPVVKQEVLLQKHSNNERFFFFRTRSNMLRSERGGRCRATHPLQTYTAHHLFSVACTASPSPSLSYYFVAAIFSIWLLR